MLTLFLFLQIFSINLQDIEMVIDTLFIKNKQFYLIFKNCPQKLSENYYYRGKPENILNIKNKYDSYSLVYVPEGYSISMDIFQKFPKSTIFLARKEYLNYEDICFIVYDENDRYYNWDLDRKSSDYYFIIIGNSMNANVEDHTIFFLVTFSVFLFFFIFFYNCKCFDIFTPLYVSKLTNKYIIFSLLLVFSCIFINFSIIFSIAHSFYKAFIIVHIIYLLSGYQVLYFNQNMKKK